MAVLGKYPSGWKINCPSAVTPASWTPRVFSKNLEYWWCGKSTTFNGMVLVIFFKSSRALLMEERIYKKIAVRECCFLSLKKREHDCELHSILLLNRCVCFSFKKSCKKLLILYFKNSIEVWEKWFPFSRIFFKINYLVSQLKWIQYLPSGITRKTRVLDVVYNASNNELVRTKTLVKNAIVLIDATPFKQW